MASNTKKPTEKCTCTVASGAGEREPHSKNEEHANCYQRNAKQTSIVALGEISAGRPCARVSVPLKGVGQTWR